MENERKTPPSRGEDKRPKSSILIALIVTGILVLLISTIYNAVSNSQYDLQTYSDFVKAKDEGQLKSVEIHTDRVIYATKEEAEKNAFQRRTFYTGLPYGDVMALAHELVASGVTVDNKIVEDNSWIMTVLLYGLMFLSIFFMMRMITKRMSGDGIGSNKAFTQPSDDHCHRVIAQCQNAVADQNRDADADIFFPEVAHRLKQIPQPVTDPLIPEEQVAADDHKLENSGDQRADGGTGNIHSGSTEFTEYQNVVERKIYCDGDYSGYHGRQCFACFAECTCVALHDSCRDKAYKHYGKIRFTGSK